VPVPRPAPCSPRTLLASPRSAAYPSNGVDHLRYLPDWASAKHKTLTTTPKCALDLRPARPRDGTIAPTRYGEAAIGWIGGRYLEHKKQSIRKTRTLSDAMAAPAPPEDQVRLLSDALEAVRHQTGLMRKCLDMPGKLMDALKCWYDL
jgi:hypothetical protein